MCHGNRMKTQTRIEYDQEMFIILDYMEILPCPWSEDGGSINVLSTYNVRRTSARQHIHHIYTHTHTHTRAHTHIYIYTDT